MSEYALPGALASAHRRGEVEQAGSAKAIERAAVASA